MRHGAWEDASRRFSSHASCPMPHAPPCDRLGGIVGDDAVASDVAKPLPVAFTIRGPWNDLHVARVKCVDHVAIDVAKRGKNPARMETGGLRPDRDHDAGY